MSGTTFVAPSAWASVSSFFSRTIRHVWKSDDVCDAREVPAWFPYGPGYFYAVQRAIPGMALGLCLFAIAGVLSWVKDRAPMLEYAYVAVVVADLACIPLLISLMAFGKQDDCCRRLNGDRASTSSSAQAETTPSEASVSTRARHRRLS